ncbi:MAG: DNA polymerase III subunit delta [Candidatus Saccharibacteria bacterium]
MITLLVGDNSFETERALAEIKGNFVGEAEKIDGNDLNLARLPDILMGVSLFAEKRLLIVRGLSENKTVWTVFGDWLDRISDDINLILIESKPDKRTTTFKSLRDNAIVREFQPWSDRDTAKAEQWVISEAKKLGFTLDKKSALILVQRVGVDQWQLFHALEKLAMVDDISEVTIKNIIDANLTENVFNLFETALSGHIDDLVQMIRVLEQSDDVYRLSALLFSQAFQLAAIVSATDSDNIAKDFSIHPYVVSKLTPIAKRIGKGGVSKIISIFTEVDDDMKLSKTDPWLLVERALIKIANI